MLYPVELQAQALYVERRLGRGRGIRTPDIQLPKLALYQTELYPETSCLTDVAGEAVRCYGSKPSPSIRMNTPHFPLPQSWRKRRGSWFKNGAPGEIRTPDHQVRSLVLYPTELRAHTLNLQPGDYRCEALAPCREAELFRYPGCSSTVFGKFFSLCCVWMAKGLKRVR